MSNLKFFIGDEYGTGCEYYTSKENFLDRINELIDEAEANGKEWFSITVEDEN